MVPTESAAYAQPVKGHAGELGKAILDRRPHSHATCLRSRVGGRSHAPRTLPVVHLTVFVVAHGELQHGNVFNSIMSYMQALAVGWSIYWREVLWTRCATIVTVATFRLAGHAIDQRGIYTGAGLLLFLLYGAAFPRTILRVLRLRYSDFRLEPRRGEMRTEVRYWEAAALSAVINLVPMLGAPVLRLYVGAVPVLGAFVLVLYPLIVGMPLAGWLLTAVPIHGLSIEVGDDLHR